jgi:phytoene synthase
MTATVPRPTVAEAYAACEQITKQAAKNFSYGIRLLPADRRAALSAVYAFSRRLDDIGDGDLPDDEKIDGLARARADIRELDPNSSDPVIVALADAARRFPIPLEAFLELADGVESDIVPSAYDTFDDMVGYCRLVAGTIGRLSLGIFGTKEAATRRDAPAIADALGVALQQTNILRDVREDLLGGRIYLPRGELAAAGVKLAVDADGRLGGPEDALVDYLRAGAARAEEWYSRGLVLLDLLDRRSAACCGALAGIYLRLNRRIRTDPAAVLTQRLSLPTWEKALVAGRNLAGRPERVVAVPGPSVGPAEASEGFGG